MSYYCIGLNNPKTPANIGSVLRSIHCYGNCNFLAIASKRKVVKLPVCTDTENAYKHISVIKPENLMDVIPIRCIPIAIEYIENNSISLFDFIHPKNAYYIFGQEDGTLPKSILNKCKDVVYIPTRYCLNLAQCVTTVIYDRFQKENK